MATKTLKTIFKVKRGLSQEWETYNPVLEDGEPGYELDTGKLKVGREGKRWNELSYIGGDSAIIPDMKDYVTQAELEEIISNLNNQSYAAGAGLKLDGTTFNIDTDYVFILDANY